MAVVVFNERLTGTRRVPGLIVEETSSSRKQAPREWIRGSYGLGTGVRLVHSSSGTVQPSHTVRLMYSEFRKLPNSSYTFTSSSVLYWNDPE